MLLISISLVITFFVRLSLAWQTQNSIWHVLNNKFISILSPDPAFHAYNAKQLLEGTLTDSSLISDLIYYLLKFGLNIDFIMYFSPALFASLIVIPTILILKLYVFRDLEIFIFSISIYSFINLFDFIKVVKQCVSFNKFRSTLKISLSYKGEVTRQLA